MSQLSKGYPQLTLLINSLELCPLKHIGQDYPLSCMSQGSIP